MVILICFMVRMLRLLSRFLLNWFFLFLFCILSVFNLMLRVKVVLLRFGRRLVIFLSLNFYKRFCFVFNVIVWFMKVFFDIS